jgi:phage FluMu gp28-like protein
MPAILPALHIESDGKLSSYFLPHQLTWIADDSRMQLAEKSVRIGWTYGDSFKNVRKRILLKNRNYLFQTKDQQSSIEYLKTCMQFARIFNFTRSILSHGEDSVRVQSKRENGETFYR